MTWDAIIMMGLCITLIWGGFIAMVIFGKSDKSVKPEEQGNHKQKNKKTEIVT